jgi:5-methylcytosine-specific restriction endonuclease McrA
MSTTYKPALLRSLTKLVRKNDDTEIPLTAVADVVAGLYWNQIVIHKLRQAAVITKESEIVRWIRDSATAFGTRKYETLLQLERQVLAKRIARTLTVDVLRRFHNSKPQHLDPLFFWEKGWNKIVVPVAARDFMRSNGAALDMLANYAWAEYLETCNRVTPRVLLKVSGEVKRESLARYLRILLTDGESECFYCGSTFDEATRPAVDHVIPWSFALEDQLWDLVLCCTRCNSAKSDWLPEERFIEKLVQRNAGLAKKPLPSGISALVDSTEVTRLYEVAIATDWPRFWAPL